jgi:hypothetical protein
MSRRPAPLASAMLATALALFAAPGLRAAPEAAPPLTIDAPAFVWSSRSIAVDVHQNGTLAGRRLTVLAIVDRNMIGSYPIHGESTRVVVEGMELDAGTHELLIKSGTYEARASFRYLPPVYPGIGAILLIAVVAAISVKRRRSHR